MKSRLIYSPPNELPRINHLWVFVSVDEDGNEGVCAMPMPGLPGPIPLVAADERRLASLIPLARQLAAAAGITIRLIKLTTREELLQIDPDGKETVP